MRRFLFDNRIPLTELMPGEIVALGLMHPLMGSPAAPCRYTLSDGMLQITSGNAASESSLYVGGANPFAVYEVALRACKTASAADPAEVALEWAALDGKTRVQAVEKLGASVDSLVLRVWKDGAKVREQVLLTDRR